MNPSVRLRKWVTCLSIASATIAITSGIGSTTVAGAATTTTVAASHRAAATTTHAAATGHGAATPPAPTPPAVPAFAVQRAIVLSPSLIELVDNGTVVATHQLPAEGTFTLPLISLVVADPTWISATSPGVYLLQAALIAGPGTTLQIASPDVTAVHLALGFGAFLGGERAQASIDRVTVTSWNTATGAPETTPTPGRPFILFQNNSTLTFNGATMTDLGSAQIGAAGVMWKNDAVPGGAFGSTFSGNASGAVAMRSGPITFNSDAFVDNTYDGLRLADRAAGGSIELNHAAGNGGSGFAIEQSAASLEMAGNSADQNRTGILLEHTSGKVSLIGNQVTNNAGFGIELRNAHRTQVVQTNSTANGIGLDITKASYGIGVRSFTSRGDRVGLEVHDSFVPELTSIGIIGAKRIAVVADSRKLAINHATISQSPVGIEVRNYTLVQNTSIAKVRRGLTIWPNQTVTLTNSEVGASHIGVELANGAFAYLAYSHINAPEATRGGHTRTLGSVISRPPVSLVLLIPGAGLLLLCVLMEIIMFYRQRSDPRAIVPQRIWNTT